MKQSHSKEKGFTIVFAALSMVVLLGISALAIDGGVLFTAKNQLQNAVDSAALAGASGLMVSQQEAVNKSISFAALNSCIDQPVTLSAGDISFPSAGRVQVQEQHTVNLFFARALGMNTAIVSAVAIAELNALISTDKARPWAIPFFDYAPGDPVTLKEGENTPENTDSWYNCTAFPPINRGNPLTGASEYESNILNGSTDEIFVGDELLIEPGNMKTKTVTMVETIIAMDPGASWDNNLGIIGSAFSGFESPRIIKIILYDPALGPASGRNSIVCTGFAAFFLEGVDSKSTVTGRFMNITTSGTPGGGPGPSYLKKVRLIQ